MNEIILYDVKEVSKLLKVDVHKVYALINSGILPSIKLGTRKVLKDTLIKFLEDYEGFDITDVNNIQPLNTLNNMVLHGKLGDCPLTDGRDR